MASGRDVITGFNTDVEHRGRVFHVQTEEKGPGNQVVETLVYSAGEIVAHIRTSYAKLADSSSFDSDQLLHRMRHQHKTLIHTLLADRLDLQAAIAGPIEPSFDELVIDCLARQPTNPADAAARKRKLKGVLERLEAEIERRDVTQPMTPVPPQPTASAARARPRRLDPATSAASPRRRSRRGLIWGVATGLVLIAGSLLLVRSVRPPTSDPAPPPVTAGTSDAVDASEASAQPVSPAQGISELQPSRDETVEPPVQSLATAGSAGQPGDGTAGTQTASVTPAPRPDESPPEPPNLPPLSDAPPPPDSRESETEESWAGRLIDLEAVDVLPRPLQRPFPNYTKRARKMKQEGVVRLQMLIDETGSVTDVKLLQAIPDSDLNQAAIDAAQTWKYSPATKQGQSVRVWKVAAISFRLDGGKTEVVAVQE